MVNFVLDDLCRPAGDSIGVHIIAPFRSAVMIQYFWERRNSFSGYFHFSVIHVCTARREGHGRTGNCAERVGGGVVPHSCGGKAGTQHRGWIPKPDFQPHYPKAGRCRAHESKRKTNRVLERAGLEHISFKNLRHTCAIRALEAGQDEKKLSAMLGHTRVSVTQQGYQGYLPQAKRKKNVCGHGAPEEEEMRQAADRMGELFKL